MRPAPFRHLLNPRCWVIAALILTAHVGWAEPFQASRIVRIHETISQSTLERLQMRLAGFHNSDPFPAGLIVLLDSPGGDGQVAMQIGRLLREHQAHIFVMRRCDSACVFVLMGGVVRAANPGSLGVHAGRLTLMTHEGKVIREIDASGNLNHAYTLVRFNTEVRQYLQAMGIQHGILDVMLAQPATRLYKLSASDLNRYQVNGIDPSYLDQRLRYLIKRDDLPTITASRFTQNTLSVPGRCGTVRNKDAALIQCYRQTLQGRRH